MGRDMVVSHNPCIDGLSKGPPGFGASLVE